MGLATEVFPEMKKPDPAIPLFIIADFLVDQGDPPGNELRAVFADNDLHPLGMGGYRKAFFSVTVARALFTLRINRFGFQLCELLMRNMQSLWGTPAFRCFAPTARSSPHDHHDFEYSRTQIKPYILTRRTVLL
jgi:hypothetical protein